MNNYVQIKNVEALPRIPLEGNIDLTYRCNNNCRHCWLRIPEDSPEMENELTFKEIRQIVDETKKMGCQRWYISGGEPMVRPDFPEIFDYITRNTLSYRLNTNGTLITPSIARLMKRKGRKWIALYGATAEVHDHITRTQGSFDAAMQGCAYLKEAGTGFMFQVIPMKDNYHQFQDMIKLAESLTPNWRVGASWLFLSASGDPSKNAEIKAQRLTPEEMFNIEKPDFFYQETLENEESCSIPFDPKNDNLFKACITSKRDFHIDPYGQMSFCRLIKDSSLRYDLRKRSFTECWEKFIPSLKNRIKGEEEFLKNRGSCELRKDCSWCPAYAYLENRRYSAKITYLCKIEKEAQKFKEKWLNGHCRYYNIAGLTVQVSSDLPIKDTTFHPKFKPFEVEQPGEDVVKIRHRFAIPNLNGQDLGEEVFRTPPWTIYKKGNAWIYLSSIEEYETPQQVTIFNNDHTRASIYNAEGGVFRNGNIQSLTLFPSDQLLLARILADRQGFYIHSSGVNLKGNGLLFVGHSEAGKSTMVKILQNKAEILCDDRVIIRRWPDGFRIHGTWSHGEVPQISAGSAPLKTIFFLEKARKNQLITVNNKQEATKKILACLIKPFVTTDWWDKVFTVVEKLVQEIPCYRLHFDKSGRVVELLENFCSAQARQARRSE